MTGVADFKTQFNASVASYKQTVASTRTWATGSAVTNYKTFTSQGIMESKNLAISRVPISESELYGSIDKKVTKYGDIKGKKPLNVDVKATVYDQMTPKVTELKIWVDSIAGLEISDAFQKGIKIGVKRKYRNKNDGTWADNSVPWKAYKKSRGYDTRPMHMRDKNPEPGLGTWPETTPLYKTMKDFGDKIKVVPTGPNDYEIRGLDEEFFDTPYVWFNEYDREIKGMFTGSTAPARPFIAPGINEAMAYAMGLAIKRNPANTKASKAMKYTVGNPWSLSQFEAEKKKAQMDFLMFIWWFMPQVSEYRYIAFAHDAMNYMSGHFITANTLKHFMTALAAGKIGQVSGVPISSKLARRTSRKALWGAQSISLTGMA